MSNYPLRLHHVGVVVQDLRASRDWYRKFLGFEHEYDFVLPGAQLTMIVRGDARLELIEAEGAAPMSAERQAPETLLQIRGINHLALVVEDLDGTVSALSGMGVEIAIPPSEVPNGSGDRFAFIHDNERMLVELFQPAD